MAAPFVLNRDGLFAIEATICQKVSSALLRNATISVISVLKQDK